MPLALLKSTFGQRLRGGRPQGDEKELLHAQPDPRHHRGRPRDTLSACDGGRCSRPPVCRLRLIRIDLRTWRPPPSQENPRDRDASASRSPRSRTGPRYPFVLHATASPELRPSVDFSPLGSQIVSGVLRSTWRTTSPPIPAPDCAADDAGRPFSSSYPMVR